jgi:hypothetical protein
MPVLSDAAVTFLSSIVVLIPNGNFWTVPLLHSVSGMSHHTHRTMAKFLGSICGFHPALYGRITDSLWQHLESTRLTEKRTNIE